MEQSYHFRDLAVTFPVMTSWLRAMLVAISGTKSAKSVTVTFALYVSLEEQVTENSTLAVRYY